MKKIFLLAAATLSLAACNNEDNYVDEPVAARVSATIGANTVSRASDNSWDNNDEIGITMDESGYADVNRYVNIKYATPEADGQFSGTVMYFKNSKDPVDFIAYHPFTGTEGEVPAIMEATTTGEFQTAEAQREFDFLYAKLPGVTGKNPNLNFEFKHQMSKLTFTFVNGNDGTEVSKITSYQITGLVMDGTFNPVTGECAADETEAKNLTITMPAGTVQDGTAVQPLIVFPQATAGKTVKLTITDSDEQVYGCNLSFGDEGIEPGYNYQYKITVSKKIITVGSSISEWTSQDLKDEAFSE